MRSFLVSVFVALFLLSSSSLPTRTSAAVTTTISSTAGSNFDPSGINPVSSTAVPTPTPTPSSSTATTNSTTTTTTASSSTATTNPTTTTASSTATTVVVAASSSTAASTTTNTVVSSSTATTTTTTTDASSTATNTNTNSMASSSTASNTNVAVSSSTASTSDSAVTSSSTGPISTLASLIVGSYQYGPCPDSCKAICCFAGVMQVTEVAPNLYQWLIPQITSGFCATVISAPFAWNVTMPDYTSHFTIPPFGSTFPATNVEVDISTDGNTLHYQPDGALAVCPATLTKVYPQDNHRSAATQAIDMKSATAVAITFIASVAAIVANTL